MNSEIAIRMKEMFFDGSAVLSSVDRATVAALSKFGAFVRQAAISSISDAKTISQPGRPPHSHVGAIRRAANRKRKAAGQAPIRGGFKGIKQIVFGLDRVTQTVVIGPVPFNGAAVAPPLLEFGGVGTVLSHGKTVRAVYRPRPFMGPAMKQELPKLPSMWADSVR